MFKFFEIFIFKNFDIRSSFNYNLDDSGVNADNRKEII